MLLPVLCTQAAGQTAKTVPACPRSNGMAALTGMETEIMELG